MSRKSLMTRALLLVLAFVLAMPVVAFADKKDKGRKQGKSKSVFVNGHDARDGRTDGRGPRRDRHRDHDDDTDDDDSDSDERRERERRRRNRDRDRDNDGVNDRVEVRRQAMEIGYSEGLQAGRDDRARGDAREYRDEAAYRNADSGYRESYGSFRFYQQHYREGFQRGYADGYRNRSADGRRGVGNIIGDIFGRQ